MLENVSGLEAYSIFRDYFKLSRSAQSIDLLRQIARRLAEFPYENVSKILKHAKIGTSPQAFRLPEEVVIEHIDNGFGGTCFSLTFLLERMLRSCGFDCYKVMADMRSGVNVHCLVIVNLSSRKIMIDPGYALYELIALPEAGMVRVKCPHAFVEVVKEGQDSYSLWTNDATGRKWRYRFRDRPVVDEKFEEYWLRSFSMPTLRNICLAKITPYGHLYLRKDFFKFASTTTVEKRKIKDDITGVIEEEFGIPGDWVEVAARILEERKTS